MIKIEKEYSYGILAIVAIVAIIAIFNLFSQTSVVTTTNTAISEREDLTGEAFGFDNTGGSDLSNGDKITIARTNKKIKASPKQMAQAKALGIDPLTDPGDWCWGGWFDAGWECWINPSNPCCAPGSSCNPGGSDCINLEVESCDGIDNDGDGITDEGCLWCCDDDDGDEYPTAGYEFVMSTCTASSGGNGYLETPCSSVTTCTGIDGYSNPPECTNECAPDDGRTENEADGDNTTYPGAPELCDGLDNNCGDIDEGCFLCHCESASPSPGTTAVYDGGCSNEYTMVGCGPSLPPTCSCECNPWY